MRAESRAHRAARALLAAAALGAVAGCAALTKPEGSGGWDARTRRSVLLERAAAGGVPAGPAAVPVASPPPPRPRPAGPLDLRTALELAETGNRRLAEAQDDLRSAGARVDEARGRLLPTTTTQGRYAWYNAPQTTGVDLPPGLLPPGTPVPVVTTRKRDFGTLNAALTLPLDVTGEFWKALESAQAGYRGEAARVWATRLEQDVAVTRAYYDVLEAQRLREVTEQTVALNRAQLDNANARFAEGRLTKNQVLVVAVALRNSEQELLRRDLEVSRARWRLNQTVGLDVNADTAVMDVTSEPVVPGADDALAVALESNPVLVSLVEEQQRLEATESSLERSRLPRLQAGGLYDGTSSDLLDPRNSVAGFVGFQWDLGTDGQREARIAQARIAAEKNRTVIERELREIEEAVRSTQRAAEERLAALQTSRIAVGQAEENLRIRQQQFDVGRATSEDVLDAQRLLEQQRATLATALYQAQTRRAELQQLMGRPLDELAARP